MNGYYGPEGANWRHAQAGEFGLDGNPALYTVLKPWQEVDPQNEHWIQLALSNRDAAFRAGETYDQSIPIFSAEGLEKLLYDTTKQMEAYARPDAFMPPVKFSEAQAGRNSVPMTDISNLLKQYIPGFITGAFDIDRDYAGFLQQLKNSGLDELTAAYQAAYDQQYK
jgi:putative aldouronate transport system substrate-binding protein